PLDRDFAVIARRAASPWHPAPGPRPPPAPSDPLDGSKPLRAGPARLREPPLPGYYRSRLARSYLRAEENVAIVVLSALSKDRAGLDIARLRNEVIARHGDDELLERVLV